MAHFATLDENWQVINVEVINNEDITIDSVQYEQEGYKILTAMHGPGRYMQCSYTGAFRKNYPGIGYTYDRAKDAFIPPQPYPSWLLDEDTCRWYTPVPVPETVQFPFWDEEQQRWIEDPAQIDKS